MKIKAGESKTNNTKGDEVLSEKTSGKTSKIRNSPSDKNIKKAPAEGKDLSGEKPEASAVLKKTKITKTASKKTAKKISEDKSEFSNTKSRELKPDKPASKIAEKISSDLERKNANYLEPYDESILFLTNQHRAIISDVISCLKSKSPFCFLGSELTSYREYYKEIVIDHIRVKEKIKLLYFDPKFGDDLSVIINKELEDIDLSQVGALSSNMLRKILVVDNEGFANDLDWELMDSLRLELKVANIGVFSATPAALQDKGKSGSGVTKFGVFQLPIIKKNELKELDEYISKHPNKAKHRETLNSFLVKEPKKDLSGISLVSGVSSGFWNKVRKYFAPKKVK